MAPDNYFRDDDFWAALCVTTSAEHGTPKRKLLLMES